MAEFPAMPLWTDAYLADTGHLTNTEHGLYLKLLILLWRSPGQRIPNDEKWIERRFGIDTTVIQRLVDEFCKRDKWITQGKLSREFQYLAEKSEKQRERVKARWDKEKPQYHGNTQTGNTPTPTPTPTPTKEEDDDKSAKANGKSLVSQEAIDLSDRIAILVGFEPKELPPSWCGATYKIQAWLAGGWPPDLIFVSIEKQMAARTEPPATIKYFEKGIADFIAEQSAPLPEGKSYAEVSNASNRNGAKNGRNGRSAPGNRKQARDDAILTGMGKLADRMAWDGDGGQQNDALSDERLTEIDTIGTIANRAAGTES